MPIFGGMQEPLQKAIDMVGLSKLGDGLGIAYQSILGWQKRGRLPRTEWTGETRYAEEIEKLTKGAVTSDQLLGKKPDSSRLAKKIAEVKPASLVDAAVPERSAEVAGGK